MPSTSRCPGVPGAGTGRLTGLADGWVVSDGDVGTSQKSRPMTLTEAAAILGVTTATLRQQIARGKLRAVKRGRDWWVTPKEVERYARENRRA